MAMPPKSEPGAVIEATVTSKGQVTLPRAVRARLGIRTGSRIRFTLPPGGGFEAHPVVRELEDLWAEADGAGDRAAEVGSEPGSERGGKRGSVLSFEEMNRAKARRAGQ
jgi:AbrB family looped-hinge helix DNA binding protein